MDASGYDRQAFVKSKEVPPPPSRPPLPGVLLSILVAALGAFAAYRYIKAGGLPGIDANNNAQVKTLEHKVEVLQARLKELQKTHGPSRPQSQTEGTKQEARKPSVKQAAELGHGPKAYDSEAPVQKTLTAASGQLPPDSPPSMATPDPVSNLLQDDLQASRQRWEATVNRLGRAVSDLDEQRSQVTKNQDDVHRLLSTSGRREIPFSLERGLEFQRLGPIAVRLRRTDIKNQRYTLRMMVDDKSVELKNRAVNEVIRLSTGRSPFPLELVVSQINRGHVSGMLSVPIESNPAAQNAQMR